MDSISISERLRLKIKINQRLIIEQLRIVISESRKKLTLNS